MQRRERGEEVKRARNETDRQDKRTERLRGEERDTGEGTQKECNS